MEPNNTARTRWAAIGAAIAVTLGAGGMGLVQAASSSEAPGLTAITACRLVDTRPEFQVGPRTAPLGPADTYTVVAAGLQGDCDLPPGATALALNVTAVGATLDTFLTLWDDGELPNASSLNPSPGQPPAPNAVTVPLSNDDTFNIYNFQGSVHVVIDVVGYHQPHHHDDRYYTRRQVDDALATKAETRGVYSRTQINGLLADKADAATTYSQDEVDELLADQRVIAETSATQNAPDVPAGISTTLLTVVIDAPQPGTIHVFGGGEFVTGEPQVNCSLRKDGNLMVGSDRSVYAPDNCMTQSAWNVPTGTHTFQLRGFSVAAATVLNATLTAIYVPSGAGGASFP